MARKLTTETQTRTLDADIEKFLSSIRHLHLTPDSTVWAADFDHVIATMNELIWKTTKLGPDDVGSQERAVLFAMGTALAFQEMCIFRDLSYRARKFAEDFLEDALADGIDMIKFPSFL